MPRKLTRRDQCHLTGKRAGKLTIPEAAYAWFCLAGYLEGMGDLDIPKFAHLLAGVRRSTIIGKQTTVLGTTNLEAYELRVPPTRHSPLVTRHSP